MRRDCFGRSQLGSVSGCMPSSTCTGTTATKEEIANKAQEENIVAKDDSRVLNIQSFDNVHSEEPSHASDESLHAVNECSNHMDTIVHDMSNDHHMDTVDSQSPVTSQTDHDESILSEQNSEGEATLVSDDFAGSKNNARTSELSELVGR